MAERQELYNQLRLALNRVAKWRSIFAGWQFGTRGKDHAPSNAVRDHREATILNRVETSAFTHLLIKKGVITEEEMMEAMITECLAYQEMYERKFPGAIAHDYGMSIDPQLAYPWMSKFPP